MISFITHVRNQPEIVAEHLRIWDSLAEDIVKHWELVLVDDCSDEPLNIDRPYLTIVRSLDPMQWNYGVKNLGALKAANDWLLLTNADHVITEKSANQILNLNLNKETVHKFRRFNPEFTDGRYNDRPHIGTLLINREDLFDVGGYDEDFCGEYGHDDTFLWDCLENAGYNIVLHEDIKIRNHSCGSIADADFRSKPEWSRDLTRNREILNRKRKEAIFKASKPIVRFEWVR